VIASFEFPGAEKPVQKPMIETILPAPIKEIKENQAEQIVEKSAIITVGPSGYDYTSIQEAINASWPGDTIEVYSGTYRENLNVTKQLTLLGIDDGSGKPVVDADGEIYAIRLSSDGIDLEGFDVINSHGEGAGIYVHSDDNFVWGNDVRNNGYGILTTLFHGWRSIFENNTIEKNLVGISIGSGSSIIRGNKVIENEDSGIILDELSSNNTIEKNNVSRNEGSGIALDSSFKNIIKENTVSDNGDGGIVAYGSGKNTIKSNTVDNNEGIGIGLAKSYKTYIEDNSISGSGTAIGIIESSENNTIAGNNASKNIIGISLLNSSGNILCQNRLTDNARFNAYDNGNNQWDDGIVGNYYSDLECIDRNRNGICDSEYKIPGGLSIDRYPEELVVSSIARQPLKSNPQEAESKVTAGPSVSEMKRLVPEIAPEITDEVEMQIHALKDEDSSIRAKACDALGELKDPRAVDPLIAAFRDEDSKVHVCAEFSLGDIGSSAVDPLIQALQDKDYRVRSGAAYALGGTEDQRAVMPLIRALSDEEGSVRSDAAEALSKIKDERAVEPLILALKDEEWNVRFWAENFLGRIKDKRAVEPLIKALQDNESIIREYAAKSLGEIGDSRAVDALKEALKDEDLDVQSAAKEALEKIENDSGI
jgi:parallel beta-helix repeat protein